MFGHAAKRAIYQFLLWAVQLRVPAFADKWLAALAIAAIRLYRLILSSWLGGGCFFKETCSRHAERKLRQFGWNRGIRLAVDRIEDCGGNYALRISSDRTLVMDTASGRCYHQGELSTVVTSTVPSHLTPPLL